MLISRRSLAAMRAALAAGAAEVRPERLADVGLAADRPVYTLRGYERLERLFLDDPGAASPGRTPAPPPPVALLSWEAWERLAAGRPTAGARGRSRALRRAARRRPRRPLPRVHRLLRRGARRRPTLRPARGPRGAGGGVRPRRHRAPPPGAAGLPGDRRRAQPARRARGGATPPPGDPGGRRRAGARGAVRRSSSPSSWSSTWSRARPSSAGCRALLAPGGRAIFSIPNVGHYVDRRRPARRPLGLPADRPPLLHPLPLLHPPHAWRTGCGAPASSASSSSRRTPSCPRASRSSRRRSRWTPRAWHQGLLRDRRTLRAPRRPCAPYQSRSCVLRKTVSCGAERSSSGRPFE